MQLTTPKLHERWLKILKTWCKFILNLHYDNLSIIFYTHPVNKIYFMIIRIISLKITYPNRIVHVLVFCTLLSLGTGAIFVFVSLLSEVPTTQREWLIMQYYIQFEKTKGSFVTKRGCIKSKLYQRIRLFCNSH